MKNILDWYRAGFLNGGQSGPWGHEHGEQWAEMKTKRVVMED